MELKYGFISADDHVQETPDLWTSRLSKRKWGGSIPQLKRQAKNESWTIDGQPVPLRGTARAAALMPDRNHEPQRWADVPATAYSFTERLRAMDSDGVDCQVLYPTVCGGSGEFLARIKDAELENACVQAYNDWIIDEWAAASPRFIPQALIPISSGEAAAQEARRAIKRGHKGVIVPPSPWNLKDGVPHINDPSWDALWNVCSDAGIPISLHSGASEKVRLKAWEGFSPVLAAAMDDITGPVSTVSIMANILFAPIFNRVPKLKIVFAETTLAWVAYELETADHQFERQRLHKEGYTRKPTEVFHEHCFVTGWFDRAGLDIRDFLGVKNILWESNFPQANSTWPNSRDFILRSFTGVPARDKQRILVNNAARLYKIDVSSKEPVSAKRA
ncbi:MAG: amidohydrolase [SAR202 cluster bacterium]|nr:amidohydrolase [SAR202 cluster bacterium]